MIRLVSMILIFTLFSSLMPGGFLAEQMKYSRVREASKEKEAVLKEKLRDKNLSVSNMNMLLIAFKSEKTLELWVKESSQEKYSLMQSYTICASSGSLGPKKKQGDGQVPEGLYYITHFNPASNFHLSLGINYPNQADRIRSRGLDPGGDIYIHGSCVTIGCLPMTDDKIKEIYLAAVHSRNNGQSRIPVYIFPFRMSSSNLERYSEIHRGKAENITLWKELKGAYDKFNNTGKELKFSVSASGSYEL